MSKKKKKKTESNQENQTKKRFHFDGKIDLGHILNLVAIIIAFLTLRASEKDLKTKVNDLQEIVNRIDKAEVERLNLEARGLNNSAKNLNYTNEAWDYILNSNRDFKKIINNQFYELTLINEQLIGIAQKNKQLTVIEKKNLKDYLKINQLNIEINQTAESFSDRLKKFEIDNKPTYDSLNISKYNRKMPLYIKELQSYVDKENFELGIRMDSLTKLKKGIYNTIFNR
ncbi:hypothetical protein [Polaribacter atrinae]|uniref:hypothetical protein n=1 Tax=Polaribacter atrinae TaxID=1333662 RepID=UPI0030F8E7A0